MTTNLRNYDKLDPKRNYFAFDRLTGLVSLEYFYDLADEIIEKYNLNKDEVANGELAFIYFNVDNFKAFNGEHGYAAGDRFLCRLANIILDTFDGDIVGRTSNDHFIVLTNKSNFEDKIAYVHREARMIHKNSKIEVRAGIYVYEDDISATHARDKAKTACDTIKGDFSKVFCYYDEKLKKKLAREKYIIDNLDTAIKEKYLDVYYQPIVRVFSNRMCAVESLVRWKDPLLGMIMPGEFIPVLENHHLIHKVDQYVIDRVCHDQIKCRKLGVAIIPASVNLSRLDFKLMNVYEVISQIVRKYGISPTTLHLEITESALNKDEQHLHETIDKLRNDGFEIWLDDFGSEYSTLNTLQNFEFDLLKIDMKFFKNLETNDKAGTIIAAMTDMAKRLHMRVLAEGIETKEQFEFLKKIGCDKAQGYLFAKPSPMDSLISKDLQTESADEKKYFTAIGEVNFLSPNPLEDYTDSNKLYNLVPTAIIQYENEKFTYLYTNEGFVKCLQSMGVGSVEMSQVVINDDSTKLKTRLEGVAQKTHINKNLEGVDFIFYGYHINVQAKEIAYNNGAQALFVTMMNLSAMENQRKIDKLETSLNFLYSIYDRVDLIDPKADKVENIYLNSQYYRTSFDHKNVEESIASYGRKDIAAENLAKFERFYDMDTLEERFAQQNKNYISETIRTLTHKEGVHLQLYIIIRIDDGSDIKYLSCVRDVNDVYKLVGDEYEINVLPESEHDSYWYRLISNELKASIFEWNLKTGESYASGRAYQYLFCQDSLEDILNNTGNQDTIYPDDLAVALRFFEESKSGKPRAEATLRLKLIDGTYRWSHVVGLFQYDEEGNQEHVVGIILDVEDEQNHFQQAKFLNVMPTALGVFEVVDGITRQLFMNDGYFRLTEDTREHRQIYNDTSFINSIHKDDQSKVISEMQKVINGDDSCTAVCRVKTGNGKYKWIRFSSRVANRKENHILVYSTYIDLEDEMNSVNEKNEAIKKLEMAIQNAEMVMWEYDCIEKKIIQTEASKLMHGYDRVIYNVPETLIETGYVHTLSKDAFRKLYDDLIEKKEKVEGDFYVTTDCGASYEWEHIVLSPVFDDEDNLIKAIGTGIKVSKI